MGPTAASPLTTSTGSALDEDLTLPAPTLKGRKLSSELIIFKDPTTGKLSEVRDLQRSTSIVETSSSDDSDFDNDTEEWVADAHGGFTPSPKRGSGTSQWNPSSLRDGVAAAAARRRAALARTCPGTDRARVWAARPAMRRSQVVLMVLAILLGPNLCLLAWLCGASAPSGAAFASAQQIGRPVVGGKSAGHEAARGGKRKGFSMPWDANRRFATSSTPKEERKQGNGAGGKWLLPIAGIWASRGVFLVASLIL